MIAIQAIISQFTVDEQQEFIRFLTYKNKRPDAKNIQLFKLLLANEDVKSIPQKLYGTDNKSAYHALRKRLFSSLMDFMATQSLTQEVSTDLDITKQLLVARNLLVHKQFKTAYKILHRAEKKAKEIQHFSLLNEIYHTQLQYAHAVSSKLSLETLITKFEENQQNFQQEEKLNMAYAIIKEQMQKVVYKGEVLPLQTLVRETYARFEITKEMALSYKSLYQLAQIVNSVATATRDFFKVGDFIIENYHEIKKTIVFTEKHLSYHIHILYLIANMCFRKKEFSKSIHYLALMEVEMQGQKRKFFKKFYLKHQCLLALNYNYTGKAEEAIAILESIRHTKKYAIEVMLDICLSLIVFYFQQGEFKKAQHIYRQFYHTDKWYEEKVGIMWLLKKNLIELLLHIELGNIEYVDARWKSLQRKFYPLLRKSGEERVITFLGFVKTYYHHPETVTSVSFEAEVEASFTWKLPKQEDIFVMSFYAWLKAKMKRTPLYQTTLDLVQYG